MATIQQDIDAIRTAVYGKDVREALADAIQQCYDKLVELETVISGSNTSSTTN